MTNVTTFQVPQGTKIFVGAPSSPVSHAMLERLAGVLAETASVVEAHLPQCFVLGLMPRPAPVLVVVGREMNALVRDLSSISEMLSAALRGDEHLDVWPLTTADQMLPRIREANCRVFVRGG